MEDVVVGILAIVMGAVFCFWGYMAMRIVIPVWGAFAGFLLGAGAVSAFDDTDFLRTVLAWLVGIAVAAVFALIAYLYYEVAVVLAFASIGFALGTALMALLDIDWEWLVVLVGVAVGVLFAIGAVMWELPMMLLVVFTTISGALTVTSGLMLLFGAIETADWDSNAAIDLVEDDWWWWLIALSLAVAGMLYQLRFIAEMRWTMRMAWERSRTPSGGAAPA